VKEEQNSPAGKEPHLRIFFYDLNPEPDCSAAPQCVCRHCQEILFLTCDQLEIGIQVEKIGTVVQPRFCDTMLPRPDRSLLAIHPTGIWMTLSVVHNNHGPASLDDPARNPPQLDASRVLGQAHYTRCTWGWELAERWHIHTGAMARAPTFSSLPLS
jgi:hypothetical protein